MRIPDLEETPERNKCSGSVEEEQEDPIGKMAMALNQMTRSLQEMAGAAGEIARGNLAVEGEPRSEQDVLANAFADRVERLGRLAVQIRQSSEQVLYRDTEVSAARVEEAATASRMLEELALEMKTVVEAFRWKDRKD